MATIKDVAKAAGVSHGTVSNMLNGRKISPEKYERVQKAILKLGYIPNETARSLKTNKTMNVGVILPTIVDANFSLMFTGIERVLSEHGYTSSVYTTSEIPAKESAILEKIIQQNMDGIIIATCQPGQTKLFERIENAGISLVSVEREIEGRVFNYIAFDNYHSIYHAVQNELTGGSGEVILLTGPWEYTSENIAKNAYIDAFKNLAREYRQENILETNFDKESTFKTLVQYLRTHKETAPDAVISTSTQILEGTLKALSAVESKKRWPRIISLGESSWTGSYFPNSTIIPRKAIKLGEIAAETLIDTIQNPVLHEHVHLTLPSNIMSIYERSSKKERQPLGAEKKPLRVLMLQGTASYATSALQPDFTRKTGLTFEIETYTYDALYRKILDASTGSDYDIFQIDIPWLLEFATDGHIIDLNRYMQREPELTNDFIPGVLDKYSRCGEKYFALPYMFGTQLLFYRKDLFENNDIKRQFREQYSAELKPPANWKEFNLIAKFFSRGFNPDSPVDYGTTLGGAYYNGALCEFLPRMWAYGGKAFDEYGNIVINSREIARALKNYIESYKYASPESLEHLWDEQVEEFSSGKAAMMILFVAHATELTDRKKSQVVGKVGYALVPGGKSTLGGWSLCINTRSERKDEAFSFIKWATCSELAIPYTILGGATPSINLYKSSELLTIYPWLPKALESFSGSRRREVSKVTTKGIISEHDYELIIGKCIYRAIRGEVTPELALEEAENSLKQLIQSTSINHSP